MDTTKARELASSVYRQCVSNSSSSQLALATIALCNALDEAFRVAPATVVPSAPEEPGVYSGPRYEEHTSPYRHHPIFDSGSVGVSEHSKNAMRDWEQNVAPTLDTWHGNLCFCEEHGYNGICVLGSCNKVETSSMTAIGARELARDVD